MNALNLISFKSQTHKQLKCITLMRAVSSSNIILFSKTVSVVTFLSLSSHLFNTVPDYFVKDFILWNTYWGYIAVILQDDLWIHILIHTLLEICSIFCNWTKNTFETHFTLLCPWIFYLPWLPSTDLMILHPICIGYYYTSFIKALSLTLFWSFNFQLN